MRNKKTVGELYPNLVEEWDYDENGNLTPFDVTPGMHKKVSWICKKNKKHKWDAFIFNRARKSKPRGCPYCSNEVLFEDNCLATVNPKLAKEFCNWKNGKLTARDIQAGTKAEVWWECNKCGYIYKAAVTERNSGYKTCKRCKSIGWNYPGLIKDWNYEKNKELNPFELHKGSHKNIEWKCHKCGYEWKGAPFERVKGHKKCKGCESIYFTFPEIVRDWDKELNTDIKPMDVTIGSNKKVHWKCYRNPQHKEFKSIQKRCESGCGLCSIGRNTSIAEVTFYLCLKEIFSDTVNRYNIDGKKQLECDIFISSLNLAIEYDGYKYHRDKKVQDEMKNKELKKRGIKLIRIREKGLPILESFNSVVIEIEKSRGDMEVCFRKLVEYLIEWGFLIKQKNLNLVDLRLKRQEAIIYLSSLNFKESLAADIQRAKEWHPTMNDPLMPIHVSPHSNLKVWWKCSKCGEAFKFSVNSKKAGLGCMCKYDKEYLLESIKLSTENFWKENMRLPSTREWDSNNFHPTRYVIRTKLGLTLNEAFVKLKFLGPENIKEIYTKEEVIEAVKRFYIEQGRNPIFNDFAEKRLEYMPSIYHVYKFFNGINELLICAELDKNFKGRKEDEVLDKLDMFIRENKRLPTKKDLIGPNRDKRFPEYRAFNKYGGIKRLFLKLDYNEEEKKRLLNEISDEEYEIGLKKIIINHEKVYGKIPGSKEWDELNYKPARKVIEKKYGKSFNNVLIELGFSPSNKTPITYTNDELISMLKVYSDELGRTPTFEEFKKNERLPHPKIFINHFGTYDKAIEKAGLLSNKIYSKEFLISEIYRFIEEFKVVPAANVFRAMEGYPTTKAYKRVFGSFTECIVSLGLIPVCCKVKNAYSKRVISLDKHISNSAEEGFVDDYLYHNNILHEREKEYPYHLKYNKNGQKRCDFLIKVNNKKVYLEYAGLIGKENYANKMQQKIELCKEMNLNLIVIYQWNLGKLDKVIKENLELIEKSNEARVIY